MRSAAASAVDSRTKSRTGTMFQRVIPRGQRKPTRCPKKSVRIPRWNGTEPQNSSFVSRNCEERLEKVNGSRRYRWMETTRKRTTDT